MKITDTLVAKIITIIELNKLEVDQLPADETANAAYEILDLFKEEVEKEKKREYKRGYKLGYMKAELVATELDFNKSVLKELQDREV